MENVPQQPRRRHRPALIILVVVAAAACVALGWWQFDRYESASGSTQNLGYALQWPVFAIAFVWAYRRFVVLEDDPDLEEQQRVRGGPTEIPEGILPDRPGRGDPGVATLDDAPADPAMTQYNELLAELGEHRPDTSAPTKDQQ